jgi:hypothetical protein
MCMDAVLNSIVFANINKNKLIFLYNKYKNVIINTDIIQSINDKDEMLFCYYFMKYQQNMEINNLSNILKEISMN